MEEKLQKVLDAFNATKEWMLYAVDGTLGAAFAKDAVCTTAMEADTTMIYTDGIQELRPAVTEYTEDDVTKLMSFPGLYKFSITNANHVTVIADREFTTSKTLSMYVDLEFACDNIQYLMQQHEKVKQLLGEAFVLKSLVIFKGGELKNGKKEE